MTVTPWRRTSSGSFDSATCTRLLTLTVLMSGIGAELERDLQRVAAVVAADALHVDHLVDADDLAFDRLRDGRLHDGGGGAGIGRGHRHLRRHDVRDTARSGSPTARAARDGGDDGDDDRQPRPVDEDRREHRSAPVRGRRRDGACQNGRRRAAGVSRPCTITCSPPFRPLVDDRVGAALAAQLQRAAPPPCRPRRRRHRCPADRRSARFAGPAPSPPASRPPPTTRTSWPSISRSSGLGMVARTSTVSVARSTFTSTKLIWPV